LNFILNDLDLGKLSEAQIADIKRKGSVVIKDVVDDADAIAWKTSLEEFIKENPQVEGSFVIEMSVIQTNPPQESPRETSNSFNSSPSPLDPSHPKLTLSQLD
jgi:hypothetical protein